MKIRNLLLAVFSLCLLAGCDFDGGVEQGRCVAFDAQAKTMSMVVDVTLDPRNPHYSGGVHTYKLPEEPKDMGAAPEFGGRLMIDLEKSSLLLYDKATNSVRELPVEFTDVEKNVSSKHPKVAGKTFPIINKEKSTITVYSARLKALVTFKVPAAELDQPAELWNAGHEMRVAFRKANKGQAIRIMNVTKTNIFKK